MKRDLASVLDPTKIVGEHEGIYLTNVDLRDELALSQKAWERLHDFEAADFQRVRQEYFATKLHDHIDVITRHRPFCRGDTFLEIGCGPAYVGEYLMKTFDVAFIGIDFDLAILTKLRDHLSREGLSNYILVHADINEMPLLENTVDIVYGGGVIEHFPDTRHILRESRRVLNDQGLSFNTVPAFNLSWLPLRMYNNIPSAPWLRSAFTYIHTELLRSRLLARNYGYELSFTCRALRNLHTELGFRRVSVGPLALHPFESRLKSATLRKLYYRLSSLPTLAPIHYAAAVK